MSHLLHLLSQTRSPNGRDGSVTIGKEYSEGRGTSGGRRGRGGGRGAGRRQEEPQGRGLLRRKGSCGCSRQGKMQVREARGALIKTFPIIVGEVRGSMDSLRRCPSPWQLELNYLRLGESSRTMRPVQCAPYNVPRTMCPDSRTMRSCAPCADVPLLQAEKGLRLFPSPVQAKASGCSLRRKLWRRQRRRQPLRLPSRAPFHLRLLHVTNRKCTTVTFSR